MAGPSGYAPAPTIEAPAVDQTALCRHCATLIRYFPTDFAWRHVALGLDHPPEPMPEGEARSIYGDR